MEKNIILCSDGTGNTTVKNRGTNVFKLFEAIDTNHTTPRQVAIYDDGVGSGTSKLSQIFGGAFGYGLSRNVRQLYTALVRNYNPGDNVYMFGFSRGAFTVRSLAGMVSYMGILDREHCHTDAELKDYVRHAYREYRRSQRAWLERLLSFLFVSPRLQYRRKVKKHTHLVSATEFKAQYSIKQEDLEPGKKLMRFIGVWDTVSAVGFPVPWVTWLFNKFIYRFSFTDNDLNPDVEQACQALSIDEQRKTFKPEVWNERCDGDKQRIEQVWFAGVHSNVGGGYPKQGMSLVALNWMMRKAHAAGLNFIKHDMKLYKARQNVYDKLYDSRHGINVYYRYKPRDIYKICRDHGVHPQIHTSAINRILRGTEGYAPGNIAKHFELTDEQVVPCDWPTASEEMSAALHEDTSLLKRVVPWYLIRKFSHGVFFLVSLYAALDYYCHNKQTIKQLSLSDVPMDFVKYLFTHGQCVCGVSCALIIVAVFYLLLRYTKEKMHNIYSGFWYTLIKKHLQAE